MISEMATAAVKKPWFHIDETAFSIIPTMISDDENDIEGIFTARIVSL
jgi:hypothetical protein